MHSCGPATCISHMVFQDLPILCVSHIDLLKTLLMFVLCLLPQPPWWTSLQPTVDPPCWCCSQSCLWVWLYSSSTSLKGACFSIHPLPPTSSRFLTGSEALNHLWNRAVMLSVNVLGRSRGLMFMPRCKMRKNRSWSVQSVTLKAGPVSLTLTSGGLASL